jgi:hypothetical protein
MFVKIFIPLFLNFLISCTCFSQSLNYREIFGEDWDKAEKYEKENRTWLEPLANRSHVSYPVAVAIIFPELIRYSALRDKMETAVLKTLYVNRGDDYANFSIGEFQMKPSFAEMVRAKFTGNNRGKNIFKKAGEFDDIKDFRRSIVKDLDDPQTEAIYLLAFIKICESKFLISRMEESYQIRFLATAYNFGFDKARKDVDAMINRKFFSTKLMKSETYCYADISLYWYEEFSGGKY